MPELSPPPSHLGLRVSLRTLLAADPEGPRERHGSALAARSCAQRSAAARQDAPGPAPLLRDGDGAPRTTWRPLLGGRAALGPSRGSDGRGPRQLGTGGDLEEGGRVRVRVGRRGAAGEADGRRWVLERGSG